MRVKDDEDAWKYYPHQRWAFNKLEVALRFGYDAGPACTPVPKANDYIIRPIYNLYGMGIGASKKFLDPDIHNKELLLHEHVPPGYFWCEYFEGDHYSIDYRKEGSKWVPFHAMVGFHQSTDNLVRFTHWELIDPPDNGLPDFIQELEVDHLNIEMKGKKIFEIHLRSGNHEVWNFPKGSLIYPVWEGQDTSEFEHLPFVKNPDPAYHNASGHLTDIRTGFYVKQP